MKWTMQTSCPQGSRPLLGCPAGAVPQGLSTSLNKPRDTAAVTVKVIGCLLKSTAHNPQMVTEHTVRKYITGQFCWQTFFGPGCLLDNKREGDWCDSQLCACFRLLSHATALLGALVVLLYNHREGRTATNYWLLIWYQWYIVQSFIAKDNPWLLFAHA